ncbi:hypothetical protein D3C72_1036900 [compost metagenome]
MVGGRQLFGFRRAVDDIVERLAGNGPVDAELVGQMRNFSDAPAAEIRHAEVTQLACMDEIGDGAHRLFQRRIEDGAVEIEDIDIVGVETAQRILDGLDDPLPGMPTEVGALGVGIDEFRCQNPVIAIGLDAAADDFFRLAVVIDISCVDEVDALLACLVDDAEGHVIRRRASEHHRAEAQR